MADEDGGDWAWRGRIGGAAIGGIDKKGRGFMRCGVTICFFVCTFMLLLCVSCKEHRPDLHKETAVRIDGVVYASGQSLRFERTDTVVRDLQQLLVEARPEANDTKWIVHVDLWMYFESGHRSQVLVLGKEEVNGLVQIDGLAVRADAAKLRANVDALKERKPPDTTKAS